MKDYVAEVVDVQGDGNCVFRAVAVGLDKNEEEWLEVRKRLLDELELWY